MTIFHLTLLLFGLNLVGNGTALWFIRKWVLGAETSVHEQVDFLRKELRETESGIIQQVKFVAANLMNQHAALHSVVLEHFNAATQAAIRDAESEKALTMSALADTLDALKGAVSELKQHAETTASNLSQGLQQAHPEIAKVTVCSKCRRSVVRYFSKAGKPVCANCDPKGYAAYVGEV